MTYDPLPRDGNPYCGNCGQRESMHELEMWDEDDERILKCPDGSERTFRTETADDRAALRAAARGL